jgi:hypothetical protein
MKAIPTMLRSGALVPKLMVILGCALLLAGCGSKQSPAAANPAAATASADATPPSGAPAPAITQASWEPDELEKLVAPIALYPDQLVGQILAASVNVQEVLDGGNWLLQNPSLKGDALDAAAQKAGLGPAMRALVQFPTVVDMMCQQLDWTRQLGAAFTSDQKAVLDAVQRLRAQAAQVGNLKSTPQQTVETKTENQKTVIEVKPANPQIIYVPQYNPQVVYTTPAPPPPPASSAGTVSTDAAVLGGLLAFGVGIAVGSAIHNDDCYPHWGTGVVYVGQRPFYPPAYVYHPAYGPGFKPAYGYRNTNVNGDVNINIKNENNYFRQFDNNQNLRNVNHYDANTAARNPAGNSNWKGQSSYAGARNNPQPQRPSQAGPSNTNAAAQPRVRDTGGARGPAPTNRAGTSTDIASTRAPAANAGVTRSPAVDRGFGQSNRAGQSADGPARGPGTAAGPAQQTAPRESAFTGPDGPSGDGPFARAASARGNASGGNLGGGGRGRANARRAP